MSEKKKYGQILMDGMPGYVLPLEDFGALFHELECCDVGEGFEVKVVELTDKEVADAPEFDGW